MARTLTTCRDCGKLFYGGTEKQYCEKCTEARKKSVMREKRKKEWWQRKS